MIFGILFLLNHDDEYVHRVWHSGYIVNHFTGRCSGLWVSSIKSPLHIGTFLRNGLGFRAFNSLLFYFEGSICLA